MRAVGSASGGLAAGLGAAGVASSARLLMIELEVFQTLRESQLLLDGHSQQGVEGLLLILCRSQLPLHLFQLCDILITTAGRQVKNNGKMRHTTTAVIKLHQLNVRSWFHLSPQDGATAPDLQTVDL